MQRIAHVPSHHLDEEGVALGGPDRRHMTDDPEDKPCDPQAQSKTDCGRDRAVEDGDSPRRTCEQDRLGERPVNGRLEIGDYISLSDVSHQMRAPPPKEKNDRKKDDAA